jgi:hypothetical protein
MEGKLRRISEFELAAYRKNPAKLYSRSYFKTLRKVIMKQAI